MNVKRFLLASLAVFTVGMVWGGLVHLVLLARPTPPSRT